jgi:hypothetical protein
VDVSRHSSTYIYAQHLLTPWWTCLLGGYTRYAIPARVIRSERFTLHSSYLQAARLQGWTPNPRRVGRWPGLPGNSARRLTPLPACDPSLSLPSLTTVMWMIVQDAGVLMGSASS